jgi:hypothetical protein
MNGRIVAKPKLMADKRITFTFFDEERKCEIHCETAANDNAPDVWKKMQGWKDIAIDGVWVKNDRGPSLVFRVSIVTPKAPEQPRGQAVHQMTAKGRSAPLG